MASQAIHTPMRIALAVDGSEAAFAGVRLAHDLPLPAGTEVSVLSVLTPRHAPGREALVAAADRARTALDADGVRVETHLLEGRPAHALIEYAQTHRPDLMVMGARGLRSTLGILLGGVAQQVVEHAHWPVLVVREPYAGLRRVLLAVDGSAHGQSATAFLAGFPISAEVGVEIMHVLPPPLEPASLVYVGEPFGSVPSVQAIEEAERIVAEQMRAEEREGEALLSRSAGMLTASGLRVSSLLMRGDAATEILNHVRVRSIDLVVAGSRGLTPVAGWLLGSVSRKLVHYAACSALIVKDLPAERQTLDREAGVERNG